jgi:hypothetical protein
MAAAGAMAGVDCEPWFADDCPPWLTDDFFPGDCYQLVTNDLQQAYLHVTPDIRVACAVLSSSGAGGPTGI